MGPKEPTHSHFFIWSVPTHLHMTPWLADDSRACKGLPSLTAALPDDALACRWIVPTSLLCMVDFTMKQFHASCRTTVSIQQYRSILPDYSRHTLSAFADHLCAVHLCCLITLFDSSHCMQWKPAIVYRHMEHILAKLECLANATIIGPSLECQKTRADWINPPP